MSAKLSSFLTTFTSNVARCFLSTKSCTVAGRSIGSSIFQARNVLLMCRTESDSRASGQRKAVLFSYTLPACCIDFSDGLLVSNLSPAERVNQIDWDRMANDLADGGSAV